MELSLSTKEQLECSLAAEKAGGKIKDYRYCETLQGFLVEPVFHTQVSDQMYAAAGYWRKEDVWKLP